MEETFDRWNHGGPIESELADVLDRGSPNALFLVADGEMTTESVTPATVREGLTDVEDSEIPINLVDLGFIYDVSVDVITSLSTGRSRLACPAEDLLRESVVEQIETIPDVETASVNVVWNPPGTADQMSEEAREKIREFGLTI